MENETKNSFRTGYTKGLGFGLFLMALGVVFLGLNFGFIPHELRHVLISWPMLLIVIGIGNILKRHHNFSGVILILIGGFFIIPRFVEAYPAYFPGVNDNFTHIYWPLLLIAAGILIILGKLAGPKWGFNDWNHEHSHRHHQRRNQRYQKAYEQKKWSANPDGFSKNSVFGSGEHIVLDPEFKGGELNAVFGGISLDLRRTNLPEGETVLDVNAVFGGITIFVPADWYVETHLDAVFGGFQDNRMPKEPLDTTKKLIITGSCVFGGGELRN
jgi:predicted membrane protein